MSSLRKGFTFPLARLVIARWCQLSENPIIRQLVALILSGRMGEELAIQHIHIMSKQFGFDLRLARRESGFTQCDVAHLIESHQSNIVALEKGEHLPTLEQICALSLVFGRSFEGLFAESSKTYENVCAAIYPACQKNAPRLLLLPIARQTCSVWNAAY